MDQKIDNSLKGVNVEGDYVGGNQTKNYYTSMFQDNEREFVVTHNANIKPVFYFTGREMELQELRQRIEKGRKSVLVSGMGGIGKTHICRKLFEEYVDKQENGYFHHIGYIEYDGDMGSSLKNCLKFKQQDNPEHNLEAAWRELEYLASDGKLLLFVDNVNVLIGSDPGLERLKHIPGAIILTSRRTSFSKEFEPYRIGFLNTEQCRKIYEKIRFENSNKSVEEKEVPDLEYIINILAAKHTITVEFLAHLAQTKHWTVLKLQDELKKNGFQLEYINDEDKLVNIQESYEILYDLSALTQAEQNILEAFSVFPYIPLSAEICNQWLLGDAKVSQDDDILNGLYRKGWLQYDIVQKSYTLHPVFAQFIYEKCRPKVERHFGLVHSCEESLKVPEGGLPLVCQQYLPFAEKIVKKLNMGEDVNQIMFISSIAHLLQYIAEYKKAEMLYKKSLLLCKKVLGKEHPDTATVFFNLADVYKDQGEYKKAEKLCKRGLKIREKVLGKKHSDTAAGYFNLASIYSFFGKDKEAEKLYKRSLRIYKKVFGKEHSDIASSYNNLASVYLRQMKYRKAVKLYQKSLWLRERVLGKEHIDTAASYNNLASVYLDLGKDREAKRLYKRSLRIYKKVFGKEHRNTATIYNNLASMYESRGEYEKAEELNKRCLRIREKVLGKEHPATAVSYNNLAMLYWHQGEYKSALTYFLNAYKVLVFRLGINHPNTQIVHKNMKITFCEWDTEGNFEQWLKENMEK